MVVSTDAIIELAEILNDFTDEWVNQINCDDIQAPGRKHFDQIVYFGPSEDIHFTKKAGAISYNSITDKFDFDEHHIGFFYNSDQNCAMSYGLDTDRQYIIIFNGEHVSPYIQEIPDEGIDPHELLIDLNLRALIGTPKWGQRAHAAIYQFQSNGLIFMYPDDW